MNENQEREAFEAWFSTFRHGWKTERDVAFDAFKAGRAALAAKAVPAGFFETAQRIVQEYANKNPKWPMWNNGESEPTIQDPHGAHAWLEQAALLAATPPAPATEDTPAQAQQAEALTLDEIIKLAAIEFPSRQWQSVEHLVRAVERAHGIGASTKESGNV